MTRRTPNREAEVAHHCHLLRRTPVAALLGLPAAVATTLIITATAEEAKDRRAIREATAAVVWALGVRAAAVRSTLLTKKTINHGKRRARK